MPIEARDRQRPRKAGRSSFDRFRHAREKRRGVGPKWMLSGRQFPGDHAKREDVGAAVNLRAGRQLFGGHVARRTEQGTILGQHRRFARLGRIARARSPAP